MKTNKLLSTLITAITATTILTATTANASNNALSAIKQAFEQEAKMVDLGNKFAKFSGEGKILAEDSKKWECVQDKSTGLYWEVKTEDGGIRDYRNTYRWGDLKVSNIAYGEKLNKFHSKEAHPSQFSINKKRGKVYTDWNALIKAANDEKLCGFVGWRVPNIFELHSISSYHSTGQGPKATTWKSGEILLNDSFLNSTFFPTIKKLDNLTYWSATQVEDNLYYAWAVNFNQGTDLFGYRIYKYPVRLVR